MQRLTFNTTLNFEDSDKAIVDYLVKLKEQHRVGEFIAYCVKNYHKVNDFDEKVENTKTQLEELNQKISKMYEMTLKTYVLLEVGKRMGLEQAPRNQLLSEFIMDKQLKEIKSLFGFNFESALDNTDVTKYADDIVEYILHSYDGLLSQITIPQMAVTNNDSAKSVSDEIKPDKEEAQSENEVNTGENNGKEGGIHFGEGIDLDDLGDLMDFASV